MTDPAERQSAVETMAVMTRGRVLFTTAEVGTPWLRKSRDKTAG